MIVTDLSRIGPASTHRSLQILVQVRLNHMGQNCLHSTRMRDASGTCFDMSDSLVRSRNWLYTDLGPWDKEKMIVLKIFGRRAKLGMQFQIFK